MADPLSAEGLPPSLRWLKRLVTVLTVTLILGVITITGLLVTRLGRPAAPAFPESLALPEGVTPGAITRGADWIGVVTTDGRMFVFDTTGALQREIRVLP